MENIRNLFFFWIKLITYPKILNGRKYLISMVSHHINWHMGQPLFSNYFGGYWIKKRNARLKISTGLGSMKERWKWKCSHLVVSSSLWSHGPPDSFVHGILQARLVEWVAIPFSRGSSWPRDWTWVSALQADSLLSELPGKPWRRDNYI